MRSLLTAIVLCLGSLAAFGQAVPAPAQEPPAAAAQPQDNSVFIPSQGKPAAPATPPSSAARPQAGPPTIMLPGTANPGAEQGKAPAATGSLKTTGSFRSRLAHGNKLLAQGDADGALAQYRDLQTDAPESPLLYYNIGCAEYRRGLQEAELKAARDATTSFESAKASFDKAKVAPDPALRKDAGFNHANSVAREAEQAAGAQQYEQSVKAFKDAVASYESFLKEYPDHAGAKKNLDYVRYRLKSMMQNPPPPQKGQQGGKDDKKQQDKQQDKQDSDKQKQDQQQDRQDSEQKPQDQNKDQESKQEQAKQEQQDQAKSGSEKKDEKQQQQQQANSEQGKQDQKQDQQEKAQDSSKEDRQNVESILQTLEDVDKREQKEVRDQRTELSVRKEWW